MAAAARTPHCSELEPRYPILMSGVSIHICSESVWDPQIPGQWETVSGCRWGKGGSTRHAYTKPAFFWSCLLSHTNSRYRRRTHEVLAVKALLLVCKKKNPPWK